MKLFNKKEDKKETGTLYAIRVTKESWTEAANLIHDDFAKMDFRVTDTTIKVDGEDKQAVRLTFTSTTDEYLDIRFALMKKGIGEIKEDEEKEDEKK